MFELDNITFKNKQRTILSLDNKRVAKGENILLLGPSGCGKTSLLNIMAGLMRPTSGDVYFEDTSYGSLSNSDIDKLRAKNFGFIFQTMHLLGHLNITQNIALAQTAPNPQRIQTLMSELGLTEKDKQKAQDLSVGEAQRVAIARAVSNNPAVIFADEPTSALDDANTQKVMDLLFDQAPKTGASIIAATHDHRIKKYFDTVWEIA